MSHKPRELSPDQLRRGCDLATCGVSSTADFPQLEGIIGQERATRALEFGLDIPSYGFNVFAMGPAGAGKTTTIRAYLEHKASGEPVPDDWCYVNNFRQPDQPLAIKLPPHMACTLRDAVEAMLKSLKEAIPRAFEGEEYLGHRNKIAREIEERRKEILKELNEFVEARGFSLIQTPMGLVIVPVINGEVVSPEQYEKLDPAERAKLEEQRPEMQQTLERSMTQVREIEKEAKERMGGLDRDIAAFAIGHFFDDAKAALPYESVAAFLDEARDDILQNIDTFKQRPGEATEGGGEVPRIMMSRAESPYDRYRVNVVVDNCHLTGAPVVVEFNPSVHNLVGRIEHKAEFGALVTNFSMIKPGALHRANGGYLMLDAKAVLTQPLAWDTLKRCLRSKEIRMEEPAQQYSLIATTSLSPAPIPLDVKVILIGDAETYYLLYALDDQFPKLFKVRADFAIDMPWDEESIMKYARFIHDRCEEEKLPHFDMEAVSEVVEYGARLVEDQKKLTTRFAEVADLVDEAAYWATRAGHQIVMADDVQKAIGERVYRASQMEERIQERIAEGTILVQTKGEVVGQVNGLAIIATGDYWFGRPSRITAKVYMGQAGVINIEREAKMSGRIHDKGVLILAGYLGGKYAQDKPMSITASLAFEQNYEGIEGDSASSTELYALLSAISGVPIRQSLAVTGSVNQNGQVQPIGGVTRKIEGFFDVCRQRGLKGDEGVLIPQSNVQNLMLRHDVVAAVAEGKFHIFPVENIDQGIEILTGTPAGERDASGDYPEGTLNYLVDGRLRRLADQLRGFQDHDDKTAESHASDEDTDKPAPGKGRKKKA